MYIDFYNSNLECALKVPCFAYKISARVANNENNNIDLLGRTIIEILDEGIQLDAENIMQLIGIPTKYKKLIEYEINELLDERKIVVNSNNIVEKINVNKDEYNITENYYLLYDRVNKILLDCIIDEAAFNGRFLKKDGYKNEKLYLIKGEVGNQPERYKLCESITNLINRSNDTVDYESNEYDENNENIDFIRPFYPIELDDIENLETPIECELLIKILINQNQELEYISPFSNDNYSVYVDSNVINKIDVNKVIDLFNDDIFKGLAECDIKAQEYVNKYKKYDNNKEHLETIKRISIYKEVLSLSNDIYKNFANVTVEFDKVVKSLLKEIITTYPNSTIEKKNLKIKSLTNLSEISDITIIDSFINSNNKIIRKDKPVINSVGETSIVSYLKAIYITKFLTQNDDVDRIYKLFSEDRIIISFLNKVWLFRNNSNHNVEKQKNYDPEYDMDIMIKERKLEIITELIEELLYFVQAIKDK